jgi:hypothetical protein
MGLLGAFQAFLVDGAEQIPNRVSAGRYRCKECDSYAPYGVLRNPTPGIASSQAIRGEGHESGKAQEAPKRAQATQIGARPATNGCRTVSARIASRH